MKTSHLILAATFIFSLSSCMKDKLYNAGGGTSDHYASMQDFYAQNEVKPQFFTINAITGGNFTTSQGTTVTIPPYAFLTNTGDTVFTDVTIEFKDIYKKSDMLLSDKHTADNFFGAPIKSGGEFYIRASMNNQMLFMNVNGINALIVKQPAPLAEIDLAMNAFIGGGAIGGPFQGPFAWGIDSVPGAVTVDTSTLPGYVFSLYQFSPIQSDSGTWCNSDNSIYFSAYPQSSMVMHQTNVENYNADVYLVFKTIKCMVHVYKDGSGDFPYLYAPQGLECTVVTIGEKDGKIYSSLTSITISNNLTVNFTLSETTTADFKAALLALD